MDQTKLKWELFAIFTYLKWIIASVIRKFFLLMRGLIGHCLQTCHYRSIVSSYWVLPEIYAIIATICMLTFCKDNSKSMCLWNIAIMFRTRGKKRKTWNSTAKSVTKFDLKFVYIPTLIYATKGDFVIRDTHVTKTFYLGY